MWPKPPTLLDLPLEIANQILEKMEPMDRLTARKVCRSLKTAVDEFGIHFDKISINFCTNCVLLDLDGTRIEYTENDVYSKDLEIILDEALELEIFNTEYTPAHVKSFLEILKLKKRVNVKKIDLKNFLFTDILSIISYMNAQVIEYIKMQYVGSVDQFERLTCLDQWKNAHYCIIVDSELENVPIEDFFHFKEFEVESRSFSTQNAIEIRNDLLKRSSFQSCTIWFHGGNSNEIAKVFQPDYDGDNEYELDYITGDNAKFEIRCGIGLFVEEFCANQWEFVVQR